MKSARELTSSNIIGSSMILYPCSLLLACCSFGFLISFAEGFEDAKQAVTQTARSVTVFALMESMKKIKPPFASRALEQDPNYQRLSQTDRAFSRVLLMTAQKHAGQIDKVIQGCSRPQARVIKVCGRQT